MWKFFEQKETVMMEGQKFKTNINCQNCINAVTPSLSGVAGIDAWKVDTSTPDKILTVSGTVSQEAIMNAVQSAGFNIEPVV